MKRRHPYRLIDAAKVVDNILKVCPIGTQNNRDANLPTQILPTSERQVRPLTKLSANEQRQVWARAIEVAGNKAPSGTIVSQIVSERRTLASRIMCPNAEHCYKAGQKITIKSNHPSLANCSGIIKQIPNRAEVNKKMKFYRLDNSNYIDSKQSYWPGKITPEFLVKYVNRGLTESPLSIEADFMADLDNRN